MRHAPATDSDHDPEQEDDAPRQGGRPTQPTPNSFEHDTPLGSRTVMRGMG
ncbi:hypothetical protein C882_0696 [Caenispirillum salinarum AK4]|uniref:Uncharacterized protein n=1 Tax=Caenispirillum salinarum AK4 TaxID=1238182 RepID=K9GUN7_9PROT|nr:hypothetical protein C882_0696 [Caenispirillum salinarum AK4]